MKEPELENKKEEGNPPGNTPLTNEVLLVHLPIPPPPSWLSRMSARFPGVEVRWRRAEVLSNSSLTTLDELPDADLRGVTMACLYPEPADAVRTMRDVRFVQLASAGSDRWAGHPVFGDRRVRFCSSSGVHAPQIGEWIIGTWLSFQHSLIQYALNQREQLWSPRTTDFGTDSVGQRMGILGYGAIGRHAARLAKALGMEIYVHGRAARPTPESRRLDPSGFSVPGTGDPEGELPSRWFSGAGGLDEFLASDLDLLVVCVPLTKDTRHMLSRREFAILEQRRRLREKEQGGKRGTFVCNVARGAVVDTDALVEALGEGRIAGAALDVTDPEPLPRGHRLWAAPNLFVSPHVAYQSTSVFPRVAEVLFGNLERLEAGEPLVNEIFRG